MNGRVARVSVLASPGSSPSSELLGYIAVVIFIWDLQLKRCDARNEIYSILTGKILLSPIVPFTQG